MPPVEERRMQWTMVIWENGPDWGVGRGSGRPGEMGRARLLKDKCQQLFQGEKKKVVRKTMEKKKELGDETCRSLDIPIP